MKEVCYHLGTLDTVNKAVKKKANLTRHTFMQELLIGGIEGIGDIEEDIIEETVTHNQPEPSMIDSSECTSNNEDEEDDWELPFV